MILYIAILLLGCTLLWKEAFQCENQRTLDALKQLNSDPFEQSQFKPECCPSVYSSSSGCLCFDKTTFGILASRGGNRALDPL